MRLFSRPEPRTPWGQPESRFAAELQRFGRFSYHYSDPAYAWPTSWPDFVGPNFRRYQASPGAFLATLADIAGQHGGWTALGAERLMIDVAGGDLPDAAYKRIMDASLSFLRASGVPPIRITGYEWRRWLDSGGTIDTWIPRRPVPTPQEAPITDLRPGETRRVAQLTSAADSNVILVRRAPEGGYVSVVDARYSDEDPTRSENELDRADSLHDLYLKIAMPSQVPGYWCDPELLPYFPLPPPSIGI
jgi:hypothetical protein